MGKLFRLKFLFVLILSTNSPTLIKPSSSRLIQKLKVFSKKRNATSYDAAGSISEQELEQAIELADHLQQSVLGDHAETELL
jgi:hypothetical protein